MNNKKFEVYFLNNDLYNLFIKDLAQFWGKPTRPYIGVIGIKINNQDYVIPLTTDTKNKYDWLDYSITTFDENGNKNGVLRVDKMIPILKNSYFIEDISINHENSNWLKRIICQLEYLNKPEISKEVYRLANDIYEKRYNADEDELNKNKQLAFAVDFKQAEVLMYKYAQKLWQEKKLNEYPLISEWAVENGILNEFSELDDWCKENNISDKDRWTVFEGEFNRVELIKMNNGNIRLCEEIWDLDEEDDEGNFIGCYPPSINNFDFTWTADEIKAKGLKNIQNEIWNEIDEYWELDDDEKENVDEFITNTFLEIMNKNTDNSSKGRK